MHPNICICICVWVHVCVTRVYIHTLSIYLYKVRIGRGYVCVHQCAMGMDRLCAHALTGSWCGLGLTPKPLTVRALPVGGGLRF
jgi:hypothetical protein